MPYCWASLDGTMVVRARVGWVMPPQVSAAVRAERRTLLAVSETPRRKGTPGLLGHLGMMAGLLPTAFAGFFDIATAWRIIARLIVVAIWREERRAEPKPIGDVDEAAKERIKVPQATATTEPS